MRKKTKPTLNKEIYLASMVSQARKILVDYKKAKKKQCDFYCIFNDGTLGIIEGQQELNAKVENLGKQLGDILIAIQEFKESEVE